jgi:hypothetical protein
MWRPAWVRFGAGAMVPYSKGFILFAAAPQPACMSQVAAPRAP